MNREEFLKRLEANDFGAEDEFWLEGWQFKVTGRDFAVARFIE